MIVNQPNLSFSSVLLPKEETLEVGNLKKSLYIGLPKETNFQENRICLIPQAVSLLVNNGHRVVVESGAGLNAKFEDRAYSEAGAEIVYDKAEVYKADILLKISPPSLEEIELMQRKQVLFSALQLTVQPDDFLRRLLSKKVSAIAFDYVKDKEGIYPFVRSMSEIAGSTSILIAAEYLSSARDGRGLLLGGVAGIPPTRVVILGAGTVGEFAARAALGLGATVKIFDDSLYKLSRFQNDIGTRIYTSIIEPSILACELKTADVVIGAIRASSSRSPILVTEKMVSDMKPGSVIVDVCIDQGGCIETSEVTNHAKPVFTRHGVIHYCVPNIASRVAETASTALSNLFAPILIKMGENGGFEGFIRNDRGLRNGVYLFNGILTNKYLGDKYKLPYKDMNLLMSAF
ncbi:MAG: alanine dehydrogenase [Bacteroidia bacterium]|nr:alanine dehydrogenase [Bacteroidia bacterium]